MEKLFGIPMISIMTGLLVIFGLCLGTSLGVALRHRIIFRMGIRNVPRRPAQTTLIVVGLMLSTLLIAAALTTGDTLNASMRQGVYDLLGPTDEQVVPLAGGETAHTGHATLESGITIPEQVGRDLQAKLANDPNIDGILPNLAQPVPAINPRTNLSEPMLMLTGLDPAGLAAFGGLTDIDGRPVDLAALPDHGIVLGTTPADSLGATVGDTLTIVVGHHPHEVTVEAIAADSFLTGMQDAGTAGGFALALPSAQAILGQPGEITSVFVSNRGGIEDGVQRSDTAVRTIEEVLSGTPYQAVDIKQRRLEMAELSSNIFTSIFLVMGLFSMAAGVLLIFLIFVLLAAERKPEMGMARAVGAKRRQLTQMFLAEGIAYDLGAALVGAALGVGVAFVIAGLMGRLAGDVVAIRPTASWVSLVVAYTLGVVVTFLTIAVSSWRVSKLNIVAAIRDVPEAPKPRASRRTLIVGVLGVALGALLIVSGANNGSLFLFSTGISLMPLSLAAILRRFGVPPRLLYTVAALLVLAYWLLPNSLFERLFPTLEGDLEMFFLAGVMMVAAATVAIVWNAELLTGAVGLLGRAFSRWLPAVKTAVAYPLASKGRTGTTIAMFSLIVFSLVVVATISANFVKLFTSDNAGGGWHIQAPQAPANPIPDLRQALAENDVDVSHIAATGRIYPVSVINARARLADDGGWANYSINGVDAGFAEGNAMPLQVRAVGYDSDRAVWDAVRDNPNLAVVDSTTISNRSLSVASLKFPEVREGDATMEPVQIEIGDPITGQTRRVTVIGVLDARVSTFSGLFLNDQGFREVFEPSAITHYVKLQAGTDAEAMAKEIEAALVTYGVQAESIEQVIEEQSRFIRGFLLLVEGFMALGLVVGVAALGVISFRSVVERRQQIGMLRAIGYQRAMVGASFMIESTMISILGTLSGAGLGLILAWQLMADEAFTDTTTEAAFVIPWGQIGIFIVIAIAAALLMAYIPSRKAAGVPIAEALRYE